MFGWKLLLLLLFTGLQLSTAADRKAAIGASPSGASIASPIIGYFWSETDGLAPIEGVPGAAHVGGLALCRSFPLVSPCRPVRPMSGWKRSMARRVREQSTASSPAPI